MNPRVGGEEIDAVVALEDGDAFGPDHSGAQLGDGFVVIAQHIDHGFERVARIGEVIDQEHSASDFAFGGGDVAGNIEMALHRAFVGPVGAGAHDGQRLVEDAAQNIARAHAASRETEDGVKLPARFMDLDGQLLNQVVVFVVTDVEVFAVFCEHGVSPGGFVTRME